MRKLAIVLVPLLVLALVVGVAGCNEKPYIERTVNVSFLSTDTITIHCNSGDRIEGSFTVLNNDIRFYVKSPARATIYDAGRVKHDTFDIPCNTTGYYTLYFYNGYSLLTGKTVHLRYRIR